MPASAALVDDQIAPDARDEFPFDDDVRRALYVRDENVESPTTDLKRNAILLEDSLGRTQAKRTERCNRGNAESRVGESVRSGSSGVSPRCTIEFDLVGAIDYAHAEHRSPLNRINSPKEDKNAGSAPSGLADCCLEDNHRADS
jgi:hypothetical protein